MTLKGTSDCREGSMKNIEDDEESGQGRGRVG